jgi:cytoskeletal protein RodZ
MTYPPQQPGPYGQDPYGQQQQPPSYGGQSSYQGLGSYGPPPPKKPNTGMIVAIVLIVLLVLGGGGVAVWVLTKGDDKNNASDEKPPPASNNPSTDQSEPETTDETTETTDGDDATNTPDDVREAYMTAYENKSFSEVVDSACAAYKAKYGTDTSSLEKTLQPYEITATADGEPDVNGNTATANIKLELSQSGTTERPTIFIKIVEEDGEWRFCGEGEAHS